MLARVLIDGVSELVFDYEIPSGMVVKPGCRVRVPLRRSSSPGTVLSVVDASVPAAKFQVRPILALLEPEPLVTPVLLRTGDWIAGYYGCGMETVMRALLPESVRTEENSAKTRRVAVVVAEPPVEVMESMARRAKRQHAILLLLLHSKDRRLPVADLGEGAAPAIRALDSAGWLRVEIEEVRRDPGADGVEDVVETGDLVLNEEQKMALDVIRQRIGEDKPKPLLLLGVTGSGKTEVYLQAARHVLDLGKTVLVLVPEISLTPQTVRRFRSRFAALKNRVAVLHSNLSQGERFDEWHRIRRGEARIVIGARSAVFAPLPDLGLILVDEEHENTYKQESVPRYHGRDVAVLRASFEGCAVVLGSATPSLESWHNANSGKYELLRLDRRADGQKMPLVRVVDMKLEASRAKGGNAVISEKLRVALENRIANSEQAILFLNRRGFARSLQCPACAHVCQCPHCTVTLTYHRVDEKLLCHVCGYQSLVPRRCPGCNDPSILMQGYGTQKIEEVIRKLMPNARVARIDADAMKRKHAMRDLLDAFRARKIDILVGTQMIAKGLHFPNVTLVGVLNADLGLHVPDFRAAERTFQLITQVAGRAGRGDLEGEVLVQAFTPHSPSIQFARRHDFDGFAEQELEIRRYLGLPPYAHCAVLTARSTHERRAEFTLQTIHRRLTENPLDGLFVTEVLPSPLVKSHGQFRFQITLRCRIARTLSRHVQAVLAKTPLPDDVTVVFDMDAQSFS